MTYHSNQNAKSTAAATDADTQAPQSLQTLSPAAAAFIDDIQNNRIVLRAGGRAYNKEAVSWIQQRLGIAATGIYDDATEARVMEFQKQEFITNDKGERIRLSVDGALGPRSLRALLQHEPSLKERVGISLLSIEEFARVINYNWSGYDGGGRAVGGKAVTCNLPSEYELTQASKYVAISEQEIMQTLGMSADEAKNVRAMLGLISWAEGTGSENGYTMRFGNGQFDCFEGHPGNAITRGRYTSSACGKYQFLKGTWNSVAGGSMEPKKQDLAAIELIRKRGVLDEVKRGDIEAAFPKLAYEWASLPRFAGDRRGAYGQNPKRFEACVSLFSNLQTA